MIQVYVKANDKSGNILVLEHYKFESVPRIGEEIIVQQELQDFHLIVTGITNYPIASPDDMPRVSNIDLICEQVL